MKKGVKIAIILATIGVTGVAGYLIYNAIKNRGNNNDGNAPIEPSKNEPLGNENANVKTEFKNKAQGDIFRQWVNKYYPQYAEQIDLSLSGDYDNSFIRKAWSKYGDVYKKGNPNFSKVSGNSIPKNLLDAYAKDTDEGAIGNNNTGQIYLRTKSLGKLSGSDVFAYFYSNGKVSFSRGSSRLIYPNWGKTGTEIYKGGKTTKGSNYFETAKKVFNENFNQSNGQSVQNYNFNGDANLTQDVDSPSRKGLGIDTNIID